MLKKNKMERLNYNNEFVYVDLYDILDILHNDDGNKCYTIIFNDGEIWKNVKCLKSMINRFNKIKKERGQV